MNDRLYRTVDDRVLAGVCGGLAVRFGLDPSLVRIGYAIVALITGIFPLLVLYVVMAAVIPEEPTGFAGVGRPPSPPGPGAVPGWMPPGGTAGWDAGTGPADAAAPGGTAGWDAGQGAAAWPPAEAQAATGASPGDVTVAGTPPPLPLPASPLAPPPAPAWPPAPPPGGAPERRRSDPVPAIIGGIIIVALGVYFLVRDQLAIDWSVVWPAGLMAVGVVVILAAFRRRD
jgi:phage shock protein PspC (stress-responsive transcriptional regulator)